MVYSQICLILCSTAISSTPYDTLTQVEYECCNTNDHIFIAAIVMFLLVFFLALQE